MKLQLYLSGLRTQVSDREKKGKDALFLPSLTVVSVDHDAMQPKDGNTPSLGNTQKCDIHNFSFFILFLTFKCNMFRSILITLGCL